MKQGGEQGNSVTTETTNLLNFETKIKKQTIPITITITIDLLLLLTYYYDYYYYYEITMKKQKLQKQ